MFATHAIRATHGIHVMARARSSAALPNKVYQLRNAFAKHPLGMLFPYLSMSHAGKFRPALLLLSVVLSACHSASYVWVQSLPAESVAAQDRSKIAVGDVLDIRVFGQDSLSAKGSVRQDGQLTMPLLGAVRVAGHTPTALAAELAQKLKPYVASPEVTVIVQDSQVSVAVLGQVKQVGVVQLESPATVLHALARAGGMTDFADTSGIYVLRQMGGVVRRIRFSYDALVEAEPRAIAFALHSGDLVVVE
jgi:polysaccharide biosynthesis/export protein